MHQTYKREGGWEMGEKIVTIKVSELFELELYCNKCGTGVILNLSNREVGLPKTCAVCGVPFNGEKLPSDIEKYRSFYDALSAFKKPAQFRIKLVD